MDSRFYLKHINMLCFALLEQGRHNQIVRYNLYKHLALIFLIPILNGHFQIEERHVLLQP